MPHLSVTKPIVVSHTTRNLPKPRSSSLEGHQPEAAHKSSAVGCCREVSRSGLPTVERRGCAASSEAKHTYRKLTGLPNLLSLNICRYSHNIMNDLTSTKYKRWVIRRQVINRPDAASFDFDEYWCGRAFLPKTIVCQALHTLFFSEFSRRRIY